MPLPDALQVCREIFDPVGAPDGRDGADDNSYVFANGSKPKLPVPPFVFRCHSNAFAVRLNGITRVPDWVAEDITPDEAIGNAQRSNKFFVAPGDEAYSATLADYAGSDYDRGHQAPAGDFAGDKVKQDESFVMSNMGPQVGRCFNRGIWRDLEIAVRSLVTTRGRLIVFTGPIFERPLRTLQDWIKERDKIKPLDPAAEAAREANDQPPQSAAIPDAFFKIVYDPQRGRAMTFRLPNKELCKRSYAEPEFRTTIDAVEEKTGFNFLDAITLRQQRVLENESSPFWTW